MNDLETRIAQLLKDVAPAPTDEVTTQSVIARASEQRRNRYLVIASAMLSAIVAVALSIVLSRSGSNRSVGGDHLAPIGTPTDQVTALYRYEWTLVGISHAHPPSTEKPDAAITFRFMPGRRAADPAGIAQGRCGGAEAYVAPGEMAFRQSFVFMATTDCGPSLDVDQNNFVFGMFTGTVDWKISDSQLIISSDAGSLTFDGGAVIREEPSPYVNLGGRISGTLLISPPIGVPHPTSGTIVINGPTPRVLAVGSTGRFAVNLSPGDYEVFGYSPRFHVKSGRPGKCITQSVASTAVKVGRATHVQVVCLEK